MKRVLVHWIEVRTLEVPDQCPTGKVDDFERWLYDHAKNDPYAMNGSDMFTVKSSTRDFEIVDVTTIEDQTAKCGCGEDEHER